MTKTRGAIVGLIAGLALTLTGLGTADAGTPTDDTLVIAIPDGLIRGDAGLGITVVSELTPTGLVGHECDARFDAGNNSSIHPGTVITVRSGGTQTRMDDVERAAGAVTTGTGDLTLGVDYSVVVFPGPDTIASLDGGSVVIGCTPPPAPTTTTTTVAPTTTTIPAICYTTGDADLCAEACILFGELGGCQPTTTTVTPPPPSTPPTLPPVTPTPPADPYPCPPGGCTFTG